MDKYFFDDGRNCWGPVKASRIVELYEEGILSSQSPIRLCGTPQWQKLEEMEFLFNACREARDLRAEMAASQPLSLSRLVKKVLTSSYCKPPSKSNK
ncbi:MAG: hypothetical protein AB7F32_10120 [Victivallaceae bacterium]